MMRSVVRLILVVGIFLVGTAICLGQAEITGKIAGVVSDSSKALIPGVSVKVEGATLFEPKEVITAEDASYFVDKLPPGTYKVTISFPGFKTVVRDNVEVRAGFTATINVPLEVGAISDTVVVSEAAPVVDVRSATMATTFDSALLKEIPHGRDTWSMLSQVPGLAPARFDVGGTQSFQQTGSQLHGSASGQTVYNVNGLNLNWPGGTGGSTAFYFDNDSFQEVQVVSDAAQAEIGVGGVQINMITRQGSNQFHGQASTHYSTHGMTSAPEFPVFNGARVESGTTITMMRDINAQAGLPVIRDKMWFYSSYRSYHINLAVPAVKRQNGSAIQDSNQQNNVTARADIALTNRQKLTFNWLYNDINRYYRPGAGFVDDVATGLQLEHAWVGQMQYTYTPLSNMVLETRFGNMTLHFPQDYQKDVKPGTIAVQDTTLNTSKYARPGGATLNFTWHTRGSQNVSYFKGGLLGGAHNFRGGYEYGRTSNGNQVNIYGDMTVRLDNGRPRDVLLYNSPVKSVERTHETNMFFQDSYVIRRFTINGGVRFDRFLTYLPPQSSPAGSWTPARSYPRSKNFVNWNNLSPRLGFAYDVSGQGRSVVRASYSEFVLLEGSDFASRLNPNALSSTTVTFTGLGPNNYPLGLSTTPIFQEGGRFTSVDSNIGRPFSRQVTIGYEQQVYGNLSAAAGYYYRSTRNNISRVNRAALPADYTPLTVNNPYTNQPLTIYNLAASRVGQSDFLFSNFPQLDRNAYHGFEVSVTKHLAENWQVLGGFTAQRKKGTAFSRADDLNSPNSNIFRENAILENDSTYLFKLSGTYNLPHHFTTSANFQKYTGYPFQPQALFRSGADSSGRTINLAQSTVTVPLIPRGQERLPMVNVLNLRFGYRATLSDRYRLNPSIDLFNVFNKGTVTGMVSDIGPNFRRPSGILGQRFVKAGLTIEF